MSNSDRWAHRIILTLMLGALVIGVVVLFGEAGYRRGYAAGIAIEDQRHEAIREIMKHVGTCRWAEYAAHCSTGGWK